jgi:hypothetical protein
MTFLCPLPFFNRKALKHVGVSLLRTILFVRSWNVLLLCVIVCISCCFAGFIVDKNGVDKHRLRLDADASKLKFGEM